MIISKWCQDDNGKKNVVGRDDYAILKQCLSFAGP